MKHKIICVFVLAATSLLSTSARSQDSREISKTVPLIVSGEVTIDTYKGSITVTTWDKSEVEIHAWIEADDEFSTKYSAEKVRDTDVRIDATEARVKIKSDYDNIRERHHDFWSWFEDGNGSLPLVRYTITMPATASLKIKDYRSSSSIKAPRSNLDFNTYRGDVEIMDLDGSLKFETYKGEARVDFVSVKDRCRFETYKGNVTIKLPKKLGFDLDADLGYRSDFSTDFDFEFPSRGRHRHNLEFTGPVNGGGAALVLRSAKGSFRLRQR